MKKIALVSVNIGGKEDTLALLKSLNNLDVSGLDFKIVVVEATPNEWLGDFVKEEVANLEIIQAGENKGFAGNYNLGMRYAVAWGAEYILIINNDTLIGDAKLIKKLVSVLDDDPKANVVSPKIYFAPGYEFYKSRYKKGDLGKVLWYAGGSFDWGDVRSIHRGIDEVDKGKFDETGETEFVSGCCLLIKGRTLEKFGYFDEKLYAYFEDNDWQQRILAGGGKLYYSGDTFIYHKVSRSFGIGSDQTDYLLTRNRLYFSAKYASLRTKFAVFREVIRNLIFGRPAQKRGIWDFLWGVKGNYPLHKENLGNYHYPIRLSIIISSYKTSGLTDQLLKSIFKKDSGYDEARDEVIVLNDSPEDDFSNLILKYPKARFMENRENLRFVKSYNRLMEASRGELILMLNSDIEVKKGSLNSLVKTSEHFNNEAVLAGKLIFPDGTPQDSCFFLPTISGAIKEYFLQIKGSYFMYRPKGVRPVRVECAVMACFLIPRKVINKVGYLNRKLVMYFEDVDYSRRLKKAGIPLYFCPEAEFYHHHGASSKKMGKEVANKQLIESAKIYHGPLYYFFLTATLWLMQKYGKVTSPVSRWEKEE